MRKTSHLFLAVFAAFIVGCSGPVDDSTAGPAGRIKDKWIKADDSKGVALDENLLHKNIYLVFDCSGSMGDNGKLEAAKQAITQFARNIPEDTGLGLAIFDGSGLSERVPLGVKNRKEFFEAVNSARDGGGTPLSDAVDLGYKALRSQAKRQLGYGEYHLVIVTDGEANAGYDPTDIVNKILRESPVVIHTIGFQIGPTHSLNQPGRTVYKDARDAKGLAEGLQEVLAESDSYK